MTSSDLAKYSATRSVVRSLSATAELLLVKQLRVCALSDNFWDKESSI